MFVFGFDGKHYSLSQLSVLGKIYIHLEEQECQRSDSTQLPQMSSTLEERTRITQVRKLVASKRNGSIHFVSIKETGFTETFPHICIISPRS